MAQIKYFNNPYSINGVINTSGRDVAKGVEQIIAIFPRTIDGDDYYDVYFNSNPKLLTFGDYITVTAATLGGTAAADVIDDLEFGNASFPPMTSFNDLLTINGKSHEAGFVVFNSKFVSNVQFGSNYTDVTLGTSPLFPIVLHFDGNQD